MANGFTPEAMMCIVRDKIPNPVRCEIYSESPTLIKEDTDFEVIKKMFVVTYFEGGPYHDIIYGFGYRPYKKYLI